MSKKEFGIREATEYLGFKHSQYTRRLVVEGRLDKPVPAEKRNLGHYSKWFIAKESLDYYLSKNRVRGGLRRFILRVDLENIEAIEEALRKTGIEYTLELAYKGKE